MTDKSIRTNRDATEFFPMNFFEKFNQNNPDEIIRYSIMFREGKRMDEDVLYEKRDIM